MACGENDGKAEGFSSRKVMNFYFSSFRMRAALCEPREVGAGIAVVKADSVQGSVQQPTVVGMPAGTIKIGPGGWLVVRRGVPSIYLIAEKSDQVPFKRVETTIEHLLACSWVKRR